MDPTARRTRCFCSKRLSLKPDLVIEAFYAGDIAEAVRIAVTIRVLVHKTQRSKALFEQVDPNYLDMEIRDKTKDVHDEG